MNELSLSYPNMNTNSLLHPLRLRFRGELEDVFQEEYFRSSLGQLRTGLMLVTLLYALFGILDARIFPEAKTATWFIRYALVCPATIALYFFTYSRTFKKYMQAAVFSIVLTGGAGIIAMMAIVHSPTNYFHYAGLLLVIMYSYTFSKLGFYNATFVCWLMVGLYEVSALFVTRVPFPVFLNDNFFYLSANLIGMFSCYHRELYLRKDFLQARMIQQLEEQKHLMEKEDLFRDLHDGIGGITTNIGLLSELAQKEESITNVKKTLATIAELSREGLMDIRNIMRSFDATEQTWQEMAAELRRQGSMIIEPHGISFDMNASIDHLCHTPARFLWLNLFRIYKEALTNVMKHSKAKAVNVVLNITSENLILSISDNGVGIMQKGSLSRGISNMKSRAEEIGGNISITSQNGTKVFLELPLPMQTAHQ